MFKKIFGFLKTKKGMAATAIVLILIIWFIASRPHAASYQLFTVRRGPYGDRERHGEYHVNPRHEPCF